MTKKLSLLFLICILSALNINAEVYEGSCGEKAYYTLDTETGVLKITGTGPMYEFRYDSAPWLAYREYITSVTIEKGITSVGLLAFANFTALTSVTIPEGVTYIGENAFINCTSLQSVLLPEGLTDIRRCAFENCSGLTSMTVPSTVVSVG